MSLAWDPGVSTAYLFYVFAVGVHGRVSMLDC